MLLFAFPRSGGGEMLMLQLSGLNGRVEIVHLFEDWGV